MQLKVAVYLEEKYEGTAIISTPCWIGRSKEADLTIPYPAISRKHCELYEENGRLFLRDNGSLNGTLLQGQFVDGVASIDIGDEFVIGNLLFRLDPITAHAPNERALTIDEQEPISPVMQTGIHFDSHPIDEDEMRASIRIVGDCFSE